MPFEEICKLVAQRLLQGCMNHEQFANYYNFLGLEGYSVFHEYHFFEQMFGYRQFVTYYIDHQDRLIQDFSPNSLSSFSIIPDNWFSYTREDMDTNTRRNAVKSGLEKYIHWEKETKKFLEDMYSQSIQQGFIGIAIQIKKYIKSVEEQIKHANKVYLEIKSTEYDMPTVVAKQDYLIKKYTKKLHQIKPRKEFEHESARD